MNGDISIGVIGVGFGQQVHVPAFRADPRCKVTGICASTLSWAAAVAEKLNIPKAFGDWRELVSDQDIQAISIAVPPVLQPPIVELAAQAGKHVFCEKPIALNLQDATAMLRAAREARIVHAVNFIFAQIPAWAEARTILEAGALGRVRHVIVCWRVETQAHRKAIESWKTKTASGGGVLFNFVSHTLYYLEWLFGPVAEVSARMVRRGQDCDTLVDLWLKLKSGLAITVSVACDAFLGTGHRMDIYGDEGTLVLENTTPDYASGFELKLATRKDGSFRRVGSGETALAADGRIIPVATLVRRFVDAILQRAEIRPNLADGLRVQALIDAIQRSDQSGNWQTPREPHS